MVLMLLFGLALPALAAEAKGNIKSVNADKKEFVLTDINSKDWTFHLTKDSKVYLNDKECKLSDLQADDVAVITYEKAGDKLMASEVRCTRK